MKKTIQTIALTIALFGSATALAVNDGGTGAQTVVEAFGWWQQLISWFAL
ncbi:MAG: hypothetical protein Tsb002_12970 [Wenzhouxiangellaceae bacterium]